MTTLLLAIAMHSKFETVTKYIRITRDEWLTDEYVLQLFHLSYVENGARTSYFNIVAKVKTITMS